MSVRLCLKPEHWPEQDRACWRDLFGKSRFFDGEGRAESWSLATRRKREQTYGHWLRFLFNRGQLHASDAPADRFTPESVRAYVKDTNSRVSLVSTASHAVDLYMTARALDADRDWDWFKVIADRLRRQVGRWHLKPRARVNAAEVFEWALAEMEAAEAMADSAGWQRPLRFRDGLMVALLIPARCVAGRSSAWSWTAISFTSAANSNFGLAGRT